MKKSTLSLILAGIGLLLSPLMSQGLDRLLTSRLFWNLNKSLALQGDAHPVLSPSANNSTPKAAKTISISQTEINLYLEKNQIGWPLVHQLDLKIQPKPLELTGQLPSPFNNPFVAQAELEVQNGQIKLVIEQSRSLLPLTVKLLEWEINNFFGQKVKSVAPADLEKMTIKDGDIKLTFAPPTAAAEPPRNEPFSHQLTQTGTVGLLSLVFLFSLWQEIKENQTGEKIKDAGKKFHRP